MSVQVKIITCGNDIILQGLPAQDHNKFLKSCLKLLKQAKSAFAIDTSSDLRKRIDLFKD